MSDLNDFKNKNTKFTGTAGIDLPKGTTDQRSGTVEGRLRYNTDLGFMEQYNATGWAGIDAPPSVVGISGTVNATVNSTITVNGSNFKTGSVVSIEGAGVSGIPRSLSTTFVSSSQLTAATNAASVNYIGNASFDVKVTNPSGLSSVLTPAGTVDRLLSWVTASGSLGTLYDSQRSNTITVSATDPDGSAVTYAVTTGSLPAGASLNSSTGAITGFSAVGSDTTSSFTITATSNGFGVARSFTLTILAPVTATGGTITTSGTTKTHTFNSSGSFAVNSIYTGATMEVLVVAGGGAGGAAYANNCSNGGGGAGGLAYQASRTVNTGTFTVNIGSGGPAINTTARGNNGGNSQFGAITANGGGGGGGGAGNFNANNGGSGGGAAWPGNTGTPGNATQTNSDGATGYGFAGNINGTTSPDWGGGGGGGAGATGVAGTNTKGGNGGVGRQYSQFATAGVSLGSPAGWFAGGGGGAGCRNTENVANIGIGGTGGAGSGGGGGGRGGPGEDAVNGTGGGGGGSGPDNRSGAGGNGIVIVRYTT
jgi:hypothetical protein